MSEELSALTASEQAKNIRVTCMECGVRKKVTVHVRAHDSYFFFDAPLKTVWPNMDVVDADVLEAHKAATGMIGSFGRNEYTCQACLKIRERVWRKHINVEAEDERL